jgi:hypothetical protein
VLAVSLESQRVDVAVLVFPESAEFAPRPRALARITHRATLPTHNISGTTGGSRVGAGVAVGLG